MLTMLRLAVLMLVVGVGPWPGTSESAGTIRGRVVVPEPGPGGSRPSVSRLGAPSQAPVDRRTAVVYLESAPRAAFAELPPGRARMDQRGERFIPRVLAVTAGTVVDFPNNDATYHNVFSLSQPRTFDLGRYAPGRSGAVRFERPGIVPIFCDIHSPMSAYVLVFSHPFFATTDDEGRFEISGVPAGDYTLMVWSELGESPPQRIAVPADGTVVATFEVHRGES